MRGVEDASNSNTGKELITNKQDLDIDLAWLLATQNTTLKTEEMVDMKDQPGTGETEFAPGTVITCTPLIAQVSFPE